MEKKNGIKVTLKLSSNAIGDSNDENGFAQKLLLTNTHVSRLCKVFANGSSADVTLSTNQLHKIGPLGGFLDRLFWPLLRTGLPLIRNLLKALAKIVLVPLVPAAASAADGAIHRTCLDQVRQY